MRSILLSSLLLTSVSTIALAQTSHFTAPNGEVCTKTVDQNNNTAIMCSTSSNNGMMGGRGDEPHFDFNGGFANQNPMQGTWQQEPVPPMQTSAPARSLSSYLVGKWHYQIMINQHPVDATAAFSRDQSYALVVQFPNAQRLGQQVMIESGHYQLDGNTLTTQPEEIKVFRGPRQDQLCDLQTQRCITPELTVSQVTLQPVNQETLTVDVNGQTVTANRIGSN